MLRLNKNKVLGEMHLKGYSNQGELAAELGISRVWLSSLLNGKEQPSTDVLISICKVLDCTIDEIVQYPKASALMPMTA